MRMSGFTLIEVLVSMMILTFISLMTYQTMKQAHDLKFKLDEEGAVYTSAVAALAVMRRDIRLAFHLQREDIEVDRKKLAEEAFGAYSRDEEENRKIETYFYGSAEKIEFTSLSHRRLYKDSKESEQTNIRYTVQSGDDGFKNLLRSETKRLTTRQLASKDVDEDLVVEGAKFIRFKYLDAIKEKWYERWDSKKAGSTGDKFPEAVSVEFTLLVENRDGGLKEYPFETKIQVAFPNNKKEDEKKKKNLRRFSR